MNKTIIIIRRGRCRRVTGLNFTTTVGQRPKVTIYFSYFMFICIMHCSTYDSALLDFGCLVFARFVISIGWFKKHLICNHIFDTRLYRPSTKNYLKNCSNFYQILSITILLIIILDQFVSMFPHYNTPYIKWIKLKKMSSFGCTCLKLTKSKFISHL